jgi:hypothetical protein
MNEELRKSEVIGKREGEEVSHDCIVGLGVSPLAELHLLQVE